MFTVEEAKADPTTHQTAELPPSGRRCGCSIHSEEIRLAVPIEDLQSIAGILAAGYLRYFRRKRREDPLDNAGTSSPYGHEVNGPEKGEGLADHGPERD
jgi:hypothetical protein